MHNTPPIPASRIRARLLATCLPLASLLLGLIFFFHPMIASGFRRVPTDAGDPRLNAYFLEHLWKCLSGAPGKRSLWNPGCGYPAKNIFAYSDTLMSFEPLYAPWRALGLSPFSAFQAWLMAVAALNFAVFYAFLRWFLGYRVVACSLGAGLFAFAFPRLAQLGHAQLLPQFYIVILLWAVWAFARSAPDDDASRRKRSCLIALACSMLVAQFYGGFYLAYFSAILLLFAMPWALALGFARPMLRLLREQWFVLVLCLVLSAAALWPLVSRYLWVAAQLHDEGRGPESALSLLPRPASFFYMTGWSVFYGWMDRLTVFRELPNPSEQAYGLGFLTTAIVLWMLWQRHKQPGVRLAFLIAATAFVLFVSFPFELRLWNVAYHVLPGIKAMRAIARIGLLGLIPAAIALAAFVHVGMEKRSTRFVVILIALLCCLEQLGSAPGFKKVKVYARSQALALQVDPQADAFLYAPTAAPEDWTLQQLDAMWAQQISGVRTVNVYSGSLPPGYPFRDGWKKGQPANLARVQQALRDWLKADPEDQPRIQVITKSASQTSGSQ